MILSVKMKDHNYDVLIKRHCLNNINQILNLNRKVLILTDDGVPNIYSKTILNYCKEGYVYTIKQGESSKSFENFGLIIDFMIEKAFTRTDVVVACGGGVVGDLAGFVASAYMRGIEFYNVPTTLLSQVDSSIGGKTAIDKKGIKNVIGAFYPPTKVVIDPEVLKTLSKRQLHSGLVEAIKMAATSDYTLFELIEKSSNLDDDIQTIIEKSLMIKKQIVEEDPKELGIRKLLNFGHTIGHAIESSGKFNDLLHGECVGIGMLYLSSEKISKRIKKLLEKYQLPTTISFTKDELIKYINLDKKRSGDYLTIIYLEDFENFKIKKILINDILNYI